LSTGELAEATLPRVGEQEADEIDLGEAALALAALDRPDVDLAHYQAHLARLVQDVSAEALAVGSGRPSLGARLEALNHVMLEVHGYRGDEATYEDLQNANLIRVIDRRKGLPVSLGLLYLHICRALDWDMVGLNFPGHFLLRFDQGGERAIVDPFNMGAIRTASELREMLKAAVGDEAELSADVYEPVGARDVLVRLQNNIKLRLMRDGLLEEASQVVEATLMISPRAYALMRELGLIHARLGNLGAAIAVLDEYVEAAPSGPVRHQIATMLQQLRTQLN